MFISEIFWQLKETSFKKDMPKKEVENICYLKRHFKSTNALHTYEFSITKGYTNFNC